MKANFELSKKNTFRLTSISSFGYELKSLEELKSCWQFAEEKQLPLVPLGQGSNVVLPEKINACVICMMNRGCSIFGSDETLKIKASADDVVLKVAAGESWHQFVLWTLKQRFYGLENLILIPGTVGAAPVQNVGAYGVELSDVCIGVEIMKNDGSVVFLPAQECNFSYRYSVFKHQLKRNAVITSVYFKLSKKFKPMLDHGNLNELVKERAKMLSQPISGTLVCDVITAIRRKKLPDPEHIANVGSFFKNPVLPLQRVNQMIKRHINIPVFPVSNEEAKISAGWLIENCGLKSYTLEGISVYEKHALILVNMGCGKFGAVLRLVKIIQDTVMSKFGVFIEVEPEILSSN